MTKRELENFFWKWERHINALVVVILFLFICAIAWVSRH